MSLDPTLEDGGGGLLDDYPDVDKHSCQLLGPTALVVQGLMGILVIASLVYKRHREKPKRPWRVWLFDVSKQVVGQLFVHFVNVLVSDLVSHYSSANACVFYFLNILIDTTLGVALIYLNLWMFTYILAEKLHLKGFESGIYGEPPKITYWLRQAAIYVVALTTMKFIVLGLLILFPGIFRIGEWLLSWTWTGDGDALQVVFTMGIFPIIMNILQFWLIDSIVKASATVGPQLPLDPSSPTDFDREPLFRSSEDDSEDDHHPLPRHDIENPPPHSPSRSSSIARSHTSTRSDKVSYENKTSGTATPGQTTELHSYPPSLSSSMLSSSSASSSMPRSVSPKPKISRLQPTKKRRSPPTPLTLSPSSQPAINSPQPNTPAPAIREPAKADDGGKDWAETWDDGEGDDWAQRVGEEDWTGRRIEEKKVFVHNARTDTTPGLREGS